MAKTFKRVLSGVLALIMCMSMLSVGAFAAETTYNSFPDVTVKLTPGKESDAAESSVNDDGTLSREVKATTGEIETVTKQTAGEVTSVQSALKFDRNSTTDQSAQKKARELYTDNGHFTNPATVTVTDAPEGYPFKYVGNGDYSGHYISHVRVIYERDAAGNAIKDANGNYVIKELQHASSGTPLHYGTELTTNIDGPYHYATGTRPQQFLLMNEAGNTYYGYCIDLATGAESNTWYALANLEDNDYYASEEAEDHVRGIVFNGYWGTESGTGSLASLKEALKAAVASGVVEDEYNIKQVNRKKFTTGYELQEGEYHYGTYVYWDLPAVDVTLTADVINALTEGEALDAMQAAIWSWANGSQATLNGIDGVIVGDLSAASSQVSDSLNGKNDPEGAARTRALYAWLMQQEVSADEEKTVIVNDKTFVEEMSLTIGKQIAADAFEAKLSFSNSFTVDQNKDDLKIVLTYLDANGEVQTIEKSLTGEGALVAENGFYTIDGLNLSKATPFQFTLNIVGEQFLTKNAYIFTSEKGVNGSQTFVSLAEGNVNVDVSKSVEIEFDVASYFIPKIIINKVDTEGNRLTGAKFALYAVSNEGNTLIGEYSVDSNGRVAVNNLKPGVYKLVETKAPEGYIGASDPMYFEIGVDANTGEIVVKHYFEEFEVNFPATAYEISNHSMYPAIPQTFVLLDGDQADSWSYPGEYVFGESNYRVVYCGDSNTDLEDGTRYVKTNLEDCFDAATANKLRSVVANSYPYVSMEDMIAAAGAAGVADAANLTRGDIVAAVQLAIWRYTNGVESYTYRGTYSVMDYPRWGKVYNDYSNELPEGLPQGTTDIMQDAASEARINALYNYLVNLEAETAAESEIDVFFYTAVGGKDVSQSLIGGERSGFYTNGLEIFVKNIKVPEEVPEEPGKIFFKKGDASNISFMLIDCETGEVEFLEKIDIGDQTSFEVPAEEGKISAVFVKQSTSGMFWFSEEVDEDLVNAIIDCLKDNNPSYKGHNSVCFGEGDHNLEFKTGKFVTYTFAAGEACECNCGIPAETPVVEEITEEPTVEEPVVEETTEEATVEEPVVEETTEEPTVEDLTEESTEDPVVDEPVADEPVVEVPAETDPVVESFKYTVKGAEAANTAVIGDISAIYVAENGKVHAVIWTDKEVTDEAAKAEIIAALGADDDAEFVSGFGSIEIEYQHNKNKTKTVTYTFTEI